MIRRLVLAVMIFALMFGAGCFSGIGPEEIISSVLSDDSGNIFIAYKVESSPDDHDVHLQKVGSDGSVIWDKSLPTGDDRRASIVGWASGENGSVYVAWEVLGPEGRRRSDRVTRLARVDTDGQIAFQKEFAERGIQLAAADTGCVILNQTNNKEYRATRFGGDGNRLWSKTIPGRIGLKLAAGINGETLTMWQNPDYPYFVVQKLDAGGEAAWGEEGIRIKYLETATQPEPQIISDSSGGVIITWAEPLGGDLPAYIWVCRIGADGQVFCEEPVRKLTSRINIYTRVVSDSSGGAIVVWEDLREGMALYAQKVTTKGNPQWSDNGVPVCTDLPVVSPRFEAASNGDGGVVVAWIDGDRKLYAQKLDASGQKQWGGEGILIAEGACHLPVKLCKDSQGGFIIGWSTGWETHHPNDSYVQRIDSEGRLLWGEEGIRISP